MNDTVEDTVITPLVKDEIQSDHSESVVQTKTNKSLFWAYFWWLFGGLFGAHHLYLGRDDQAFIWFCSLGGFILGWLRDIYRIPSYVAEANDSPEYVEWFKNLVKSKEKV